MLASIKSSFCIGLLKKIQLAGGYLLQQDTLIHQKTSPVNCSYLLQSMWTKIHLLPAFLQPLLLYVASRNGTYNTTHSTRRAELQRTGTIPNIVRAWAVRLPGAADVYCTSYILPADPLSHQTKDEQWLITGIIISWTENTFNYSSLQANIMSTIYYEKEERSFLENIRNAPFFLTQLEGSVISAWLTSVGGVCLISPKWSGGLGGYLCMINNSWKACQHLIDSWKGVSVLFYSSQKGAAVFPWQPAGGVCPRLMYSRQRGVSVFDWQQPDGACLLIYSSQRGVSDFDWQPSEGCVSVCVWLTAPSWCAGVTQ